MYTADDNNTHAKGLLKAVPEIAAKMKNTEVGAVGEFPTHILPAQLADIINALSKYKSFPVQFTGASILYAIGLATGNTHKVDSKGWVQSGVLFMLNIGESGTNKSSPATWALQPIRDRDTHNLRNYKLQKEQYNRDLAVFKKAKADSGAVEPVQPKEVITLLSDFTIEGLIAKHENNLRGVGVFCDELLGMIIGFDKYGKSDTQQKLLSLWSLELGNISRKNADTISISKPFVSVLGNTQPDILPEFYKNGRDKDGFMNRFCISFPSGLTKPPLSRERMPQQFENDYTNIINRILDIPTHRDDYGGVIPNIMPLSEPAFTLYRQWHESNRQNWEAANDSAEKGVIAKLDSIVLRLSLILQMAYYACNEGGNVEISEKATKGAIELGEYFKDNAFKVLRFVGDEAPEEFLDTRRATIYAALPQEFTTGEMLTIVESLPIEQKNREATLKECRSLRIALVNKKLLQKAAYGKWQKITNHE